MDVELYDKTLALSWMTPQCFKDVVEALPKATRNADLRSLARGYERLHQWELAHRQALANEPALRARLAFAAGLEGVTPWLINEAARLRIGN